MPNPHFKAPFETSTRSLASLFANGSLSIPQLQRPFAWRVAQAEDLLNDIEQVCTADLNGNTHARHFFGNIVLLSRTQARWEIIDGQQRLTTVSVLLGRIELALQETLSHVRLLVTDTLDPQEVAKLAALEGSLRSRVVEVNACLWFDAGLTRGGSSDSRPRLTVSKEVRKTFLSLISGGDGRVSDETSPPARHLREIAEFMTTKLVSPSDSEGADVYERGEYLDRLVRVVTRKLLVVVMSTAEGSAGFELFQSLNARGLPLNVIDLLKVWMLSVLAEYPKQGVADEINKVLVRLGDQSVENQLEFFSDFYIARTGMQPPRNVVEGSNRLTSLARQHIFHDPHVGGTSDSMSLPERIKHETELIDRWLPSWERLKKYATVQVRRPPQFDHLEHADWVGNRLELLLGTNRHQGGFPLLMVAADACRNEPATFKWFIHALERFFFRYRVICGGPERNIAKTYQMIIQDIESYDTVRVAFVRQALTELMLEHADDEKFKQRLLLKLDYSGQAARIRIKYFLEMIDEYSYVDKPAHRQGLLDLSKWHIEHIVPQNPAEGDLRLPDDVVNQIGNLCLLPPSVNIHLSNLNFKAKRKKIKAMVDKGVNLAVVDADRIFLQHDANEWTATDAGRRVDRLLDFALVVFPGNLMQGQYC